MKDGRFETQPKFYFGQKVISKETEEIFEVSAVIWHENKRFMYLVKPDSVIHKLDYNGGYWESDLEIYEEPKPKKKITLYRYTYQLCSGEIKTSYWTSLNFSEYYDENPDTRLMRRILKESKEVEYDDV